MSGSPEFAQYSKNHNLNGGSIAVCMYKHLCPFSHLFASIFISSRAISCGTKYSSMCLFQTVYFCCFCASLRQYLTSSVSSCGHKQTISEDSCFRGELRLPYAFPFLIYNANRFLARGLKQFRDFFW